jgi:hypothetical protein
MGAPNSRGILACMRGGIERVQQVAPEKYDGQKPAREFERHSVQIADSEGHRGHGEHAHALKDRCSRFGAVD